MNDYTIYIPEKSKRLQTRQIETAVLADDETLTGMVQGKEAQKGEEYLAQAWDYLSRRFTFQYEVETVISLPGRPKELDFLVWVNGLKKVVEVDGIFHDQFGERALDEIRDHLLIEPLKSEGIHPIITHIDEINLRSFEAALTQARMI